MTAVLNYNKIKNILDDRVKDDQFFALKELPTPDTFKGITKATQRIIGRSKSYNRIGRVEKSGRCVEYTAYVRFI
jgi:hypothetical protein